MNILARVIIGLAAFLGTVLGAISAQTNSLPLEQRQWFETRTAHFNIYSCGEVRDIYKLAGRLEQFCKAYSQLAGMQSVDSPPIVVMAFPDHETMEPFLPLYQGKPKNLAAFFQHGVDENLIVLSLPEAGAAETDMSVIYHEYSHLLFRRNDRIWPLWLKEGMAEVYSTFQTTGSSVRIADAITNHLEILRQSPLMPLAELFAVTNGSPQYNERDRQGTFYAESWLLTHFLMAGDHGLYRTRFGQFNALMRDGQLPITAFTNAYQTTLSAAENALQRYLERGVLPPIDLALTADISAPIRLATRPLTLAEVHFRLGDELLRIDRADAAEAQFIFAQKLAPNSPLPEEGLGLLANQREQHTLTLNHLQRAIALGSTSFLVFYVCAEEEYRAVAATGDKYARVKNSQAADILEHLNRSVALMPDFGPSQQLYGFFQMVQGEQMAYAGQHLQRSIQLEPENQSYLLSWAQFQYRTKNIAAARQTLETLLQPSTEAKLREYAQDLLLEINRRYPVNN
jgi:hypothetical protein